VLSFSIFKKIILGNNSYNCDFIVLLQPTLLIGNRMMRYKLTPLTGQELTITPPASKSISNRALLLHALSGGSELPDNLSDCDDTRVMLAALLGQHAEVDIQAAGTAMRFLTAYYALTDGTHVLTGTARMKQRPIHLLVDALRELGARIEYVESEGFPPLRITGTTLHGGELTLAGNISSQYVSALLMIAPLLKEGLKLHLTGEIVSRPYIALTLHLMKAYGVEGFWQDDSTLCVPHSAYTPCRYHIESDWSAASYWYELLALCEGRADLPTSIRLNGLHADSPQGDKKGAEYFRLLGIDTVFDADGCVLSRSTPRVSRLDADFTEIPDLVQTFAVACCLLDIPFRFSGVQSLVIKETDRIAALITELKKLGCELTSENHRTLLWEGARCFPLSDTPTIDTYDDHRMAMAFAPAAIRVPGLCMNHPGVVTKSYPRFWNDLDIIIKRNEE
jgi:3-phosphoshikimate 1-carboxyvinyltransferase